MIASFEEGGYDWFTGAYRREGGVMSRVYAYCSQTLGYATVLGLVTWHPDSYPPWILYHRQP